MAMNRSSDLSILIKNARVLTMDDDDTEYEKASILVRGSKIEAIGPDLRPPGNRGVSREIDASGMLAMPGVTNAHFHSTCNLLKGAPPDTLAPMLLALYGMRREASALAPDPGLVRTHHYMQTALGAVEMLKRGVTGVVGQIGLRESDRRPPIGIGTDEVDTDGTCNPWGAAKTALITHNLRAPAGEHWTRAEDVLRCLTRGGARGMCRDDAVGMLAPGYEADLILIDLRTIPFVPLNDLRSQLIMGDQGSSVRMTMVGGRIVMEDGVVLTLNERDILDACRTLPQLPLLDMEGTSASRELENIWREAERQADRTDVGFDRMMR